MSSTTCWRDRSIRETSDRVGHTDGFEDVVESELAIVKQAVNIAGYTHLLFESKLQRAYRRGSVTVKADLAPATHGETHKGVLGGGDASQPFQTLPLGHTPLSYLVAPVPGGAEARWSSGSAACYGRKPQLSLGSGRPIAATSCAEMMKARRRWHSETGARADVCLPVSRTFQQNTGANWVRGESCRRQDRAARLTPRFVRAVINPVPAAGGADPESSIDTRRNAPGSVRTFGRIVSLNDFEDFARAFAGVAKAQASLLQIGEARVVHVTIAGAGGVPVSPESALYRDLLSAIDSVRDRFQRLLVAAYEKRYFDVTASTRASGLSGRCRCGGRRRRTARDVLVRPAGSCPRGDLERSDGNHARSWGR